MVGAGAGEAGAAAGSGGWKRAPSFYERFPRTPLTSGPGPGPLLWTRRESGAGCGGREGGCHGAGLRPGPGPNLWRLVLLL